MPLAGAVLVVDDDLSVRTALRRLLESAGFAVLTASNGAEGLRVLRSPLPIGAVVLDVMMPVMTGIELLEQKNTDPELRDIPVMLLSAHANDVVYVPRVHAVFHKPVNPENLLRALERLDAC